MALRRVNASDLLGRIMPGTTVYDSEGKSHKVEAVKWFGDYALDVIFCDDGRSFPATEMRISA